MVCGSIQKSVEEINAGNSINNLAFYVGGL